MHKRTLDKVRYDEFYNGGHILAYMRDNDICKTIYRKYIDEELPGNNGIFYSFDMKIKAGHSSYVIEIHYYDLMDKRYKWGVLIDKSYLIDLKADEQDDMYYWLVRMGGIDMKGCFESLTKSDAEVAVTYFDNLFTRHCRKLKLKFSSYSEYKFFRKSYHDFVCEKTKKYESIKKGQGDLY